MKKKTNIKEVYASLFVLYLSGNPESIYEIETHKELTNVRHYLRKLAHVDNRMRAKLIPGYASYDKTLMLQNNFLPIILTRSYQFPVIKKYSKRGTSTKNPQYRSVIGWIFYYNSTIRVDVGIFWLLKHFKEMRKLIT